MAAIPRTTPEGEREVLRVKTLLVDNILERIKPLTQTAAAEKLETNQPRISDLSRRKYESFTVQALLTFAARLGLTVQMDVIDPNAAVEPTDG